jgi:glycopeptide antibiotics resistance protein
MLIRRISVFVLSILAGLLSRSSLIDLPPFIDAYIGDVIWAFMVFYLFAIVFYKAKLKKPLLVAFVFSFVIEFSQMYHAPWIDHIRSIKVFALVLGRGFLWTDLVCYTVGISGAYLLEIMLDHQLRGK